MFRKLWEDHEVFQFKLDIETDRNKPNIVPAQYKSHLQFTNSVFSIWWWSHGIKEDHI